MSTNVLEAYKGHKVLTQDIELGRYSYLCDKEEVIKNGKSVTVPTCFIIRKQFICGCYRQWTDHYHSGKRTKNSFKQKRCKKHSV